MGSLTEGISKLESEKLTENGALTYSTSLSHLVDLFGMGASMRSRSTVDKIQIFSRAFAEDKLLALKALFYIRDCRGGQGEREFFRVCYKWLANNYPSIASNNLLNVVKFGRFDDLFILRKTPLQNHMLNFIIYTWEKDIAAYRKQENISLLAKWLPSENASSKQTVNMARWFIRKFRISRRNYRITLSTLRNYIDVVETKMSNKKWEEINYEKVPSYASKNYRNAFIKHDEDRYNEFIEQVKQGKAKINAKTLYPFDLVKSYVYYGWGTFFRDKIDPTIEEQWKALPDYFNGKKENSLCMVDTSGSMQGDPIAIALSLGLYAAERNTGLFHNYFMTFSERPNLQKIEGNSLLEKITNMSKASWDMNTNLALAFEIILNAAKVNNIPENEMVKKLYIISDMEFDRCVQGDTLFAGIKNMYKNSGYTMPEIVFWNVSARTNNLPVRFHQSGAALVSGMSPSIFESVVGGEINSPLDTMLKVLNRDRYKSVVIKE